jgi:hypothetical protein
MCASRQTTQLGATRVAGLRKKHACFPEKHTWQRQIKSDSKNAIHQDHPSEGRIDQGLQASAVNPWEWIMRDTLMKYLSYFIILAALTLASALAPTSAETLTCDGQPAAEQMMSSCNEPQPDPGG